MTKKQRSADSAKLNFPEGKRSYFAMWGCHMRRSGRIPIPSNQATNCHPQSTTAYRALVSRSRPDTHVMTSRCYIYLLTQTLVFKGLTLTFLARNWTLKRNTGLVGVASPVARKRCLCLTSVNMTSWY